MNLRGVGIAFYCVLVVVGVWWILHRNRPVPIDFIATRDLPLNRLLQPGDVVPAGWDKSFDAALIGEPRPDDFAGRYVSGDVPKGAMLRLEETASVPIPVQTAGHVALLAMLPRERVRDINAGSCVRLKSTDVKPFLVRTILCPAITQADCAAVIDVPADRLAAIDAAPIIVDAGIPCS